MFLHEIGAPFANEIPLIMCKYVQCTPYGMHKITKKEGEHLKWGRGADKMKNIGYGLNGRVADVYRKLAGED